MFHILQCAHGKPTKMFGEKFKEETTKKLYLISANDKKVLLSVNLHYFCIDRVCIIICLILRTTIDVKLSCA